MERAEVRDVVRCVACLGCSGDGQKMQAMSLPPEYFMIRMFSTQVVVQESRGRYSGTPHQDLATKPYCGDSRGRIYLACVACVLPGDLR